MVNMQICANGHYYDGSRYTECPYCKPNQQPEYAPPIQSGNPGVTVPADAQSPNNPGVTVPADGYTPVTPYGGQGGADEGKTVSFEQTENGVRPVVGWLVCIDGPDKGRDYRLHTNYNFVGRGANMDVCIAHDQAIKRDKHFSVSYDARHNRFFAYMGNGEEMVYLNDQPLSPAGTPLNSGDKIEVAGTTLLFIAFDHKWEDKE